MRLDKASFLLGFVKPAALEPFAIVFNRFCHASLFAATARAGVANDRPEGLSALIKGEVWMPREDYNPRFWASRLVPQAT